MHLVKLCSLAILLACGMCVTNTAVAYDVINGGFETNDGTSPANWTGTAAIAGFGLSTDAFQGGFALELASPATNASGAEQNTLASGAPALTAGDELNFSFYSQGFAGTTGNVAYRVALLAGNGAILSDTGFVQFQGQINDTSYSLITADIGVVPAGATSALVQFNHAIGPIDDDNNLLAGSVLIDEVSLVTAVPEPTSLALLGLGACSLVLRRRRR